MEWQDLGTFTLSKDWQYSSQVKSKDFKIVYLSSPLEARHSAGMIALANMPQSDVVDSIEFFKPQRISSYLPSEIISFPEPIKGWDYRLAIRKLVLPNQPTTDFTIQIFMPVVDLTPDQPQKPLVNPAISTTKNPISVGVGPTANTAIRLLPVNATSSRKHATFYNTSSDRNLFIDTDSTVTPLSAIAKVAPGRVYIADIPGWQGEYWGMLDGTGSTAVTVSIEEYI